MPTANDDPVSRNTWIGTATTVTCVPMNDSISPMYSSRNWRESRSGWTSTRTRRRAPVDGLLGSLRYSGRFASMASTTSGASGSVIGRKRATTSPPGATRNFSKFHWMSPALPSVSGTWVSSS